MAASKRLLLVHAHPDDEALATGGTIAKYSAEGAHVCLVTCTNGELGEVADVPELGPVDEVKARLGEVRRAELAEACRLLGDVDLRMLGYHDSGMAGTADNDDPKVFINQDIRSVIAKITSIIDELQPQVVVTYNEFGGYGHPDHIRSYEAATRAVSSADHKVPRIYHTAFPKSLLRAGREMWTQIRGEDADDLFDEEEVERIATDDELIGASIDVSKHIEAKFAALEAHKTQLGTTHWIFAVPDEYRTLAFGTEHYVLAGEPVPSIVADDLFEGL